MLVGSENSDFFSKVSRIYCLMPSLFSKPKVFPALVSRMIFALSPSVGPMLRMGFCMARYSNSFPVTMPLTVGVLLSGSKSSEAVCECPIASLCGR